VEPPDFIALKGSTVRDPDGSQLREAMTAHFALERARFVRIVWVHCIAALSVPVWLLAFWPQWLSPAGRTLVLVSWAVSVLAAVGARAAEWRWRWIRDRNAASLRVDPPRRV
jgi:hypothetical protein